MSTFQPTAEQENALALFATGESMVIEAGAGTGKTSTLLLLSEAAAGRQGVYLAFNRSIVEEAKRKMPANVQASTVHSVAFRAVGKAYSHRLNSNRMRSSEVARMLRLDPIYINFAGERKVLQPDYLAGLVMRAISNYCNSADDVPGTQHVPYIDGIDMPTEDGRRTFANNREVAKYLVPVMARAWTDLSSTTGQLRFSHDIYVKIWQLSRPNLRADFVLFDECQPPGTMVATPTGERPIESLIVGDRVVGYSQQAVRLNPSGNTVLGISVRPFDGALVTAKADGMVSRYTPNHICIAKIGAAFEGKSVVYLMRRGDQYRVGVTSAHHGGRGNTSGVRGRLFEEQGDSAWVLATFDDKRDALMEEEYVSAAFGIPQVRFIGDRFGQLDRERVDGFWARFGDNTEGGRAALAFYGRDVRYPLINRDRRYLLYARPTMVRACNLLDGMLVLDATKFAALGGKGRHPEAWVPLSVGREPYAGPVYSLDVAVNHTYVADGIVTHNCQDASPVMAAAIGYQTCQRAYVGDSQQAIYEWRGAVNALANFDTDNRAYLSQSWRFGDAIASVANKVLTMIPDAKLRLKGAPGMDSKIEAVARPSAILCRTNARAVVELLNAQKAGTKVHLIGGGAEVARFARGARDLMDKGSTSHPELACFTSWLQVQEYVEHDPQGSELRLLVRLVDEFTPETIIEALERMPAEVAADLVISTAHKAKGREWPTVRLAGDFPTEATGPEEMRLLYVAVTRAQNVLDITAVPLLTDMLDPEPTVEPVPEVPVAAKSEPLNAGPFECQGPGCGRTFMLGRRSGLADERFCGGVCRSKASIAVAV